MRLTTPWMPPDWVKRQVEEVRQISRRRAWARNPVPVWLPGADALLAWASVQVEGCCYDISFSRRTADLLPDLDTGWRGAARRLLFGMDNLCERGRALLHLGAQRGKHSDDFGGGFPFDWMYRFESDRTRAAWGNVQRAAYTAKGAVCIALGLFRRASHPAYDDVELATWDHGGPSGEYGSCDWQSLQVGIGVFRDWFFDVRSDSSC